MNKLNQKRFIAIAFALIMLVSGVAVLTSAIQPQINNNISPNLSAPNSPGSSVSTSPTLSANLNYYTSLYSGQNATHTVTISASQGSAQTLSISKGYSSASSTKATYSFSFTGNYWSGSCGLDFSMEIETGTCSPVTDSNVYSFGYWYFNLTSPNGHTYTTATASCSTSTNAWWGDTFGFNGVPTQSGTWTVTSVLTADPNAHSWNCLPGNIETTPNLPSVPNAGESYDSQGTITWGYAPAFNPVTVNLNSLIDNLNIEIDLFVHYNYILQKQLILSLSQGIIGLGVAV